jgi:hypothetical protein
MNFAVVDDRAVGAGILEQRAEAGRVGIEVGASPTTTSMPCGTARVRTTSSVCGWQSLETKKRLRAGIDPHGVEHGHRLGGGGGFVEQRGVGDVEAGQVGDHGLEIEQRFEPALRDLGLVGRVGVYQPGFSRMLRWMTGGVIVS